MSSMERFTQRARRVLSLAHEEAERMRHTHIGTEHLLLGLMLEDGGIAGRVLRELGLEFDRVRDLIERMVGLGEYTTQRPTLSPGTQKVLELAVDQARELGHHYIGVEHLLLGVIELDEGIALDALRQLGVTPEQVRRQTHRILKETKSAQRERGQQRRRKGKEAEAKGKSKSKTPLVDQLATDLTQMAEDGKLDPVIGRQMEIERVVQILARRTKNNPALTGEPGVGKTAIVEGLAQRILEGDVPIPLLGKRLLQLDVGSLVAGTMYRGQFEDRLKRVIQELKSSDSVLFIDEVHMLVGAGSAGSAMDAANILKPALSRGELQVIGATTLDEYRKHIESDAALERRFQPILVEEPSPEETIDILKGIRPAYEAHHQLSILDEALESATSLSTRYVSDRFLPDKAIDLIDEAASRVRMYKSPVAETTKELVGQLRDIRKQFDKVKEEAGGEPYEADIQGLEKQRTEIEAELERLRTTWDRENSPNVTSDDIAEIVAMWTGVPVMQMVQEESERLLLMEEELKQSIIGQNEAIETIAKAVRRARAGLKDPKRPIGTFVFLGPTGVGKTELTKTLARFLFGSEDALIQLDMSEFMERHSISRLVGAPPGYIGYDEAGQLTEAIRRRPYSIIVFDEIEKAHPEAHNMLLQIMEEGQLTDAKGRKVDFRNAIIVMTSNVGADMIKRQSGLGFELKRDEETEEKQEYQKMHKQLMKSLKRLFRPEFVNRLDSVIVFRALAKEAIREIVSLELGKVSERLVEHAISLDITPEAIDLIADLGYDPDMGARPLRRVIQQKIEEPLSDALLAGKFNIGDTVLVDIEPTEDDEPEIVLLPAESKDDSSEDEPEEIVAA
ncbi:MAG: ATP-dependent Clp protease ATP-binding subunit [Anaerolineales bacterium]|nr:ATP-dependent Clp protease ATP-binding subunit [Chloroflexota bacterium]MBL6980834.1 ATP-dependent Clp protease ATP-binding subunit [Anaerolineales bacterium]